MMNRIIKNTGIVLLCSVLAKGLSYIWEAILAAYLGAGEQADALYMTTSVFNILYPIMDLGIWKVFLPAYKKRLSSGEAKDADQIANSTITLFLAMSFALVLFLVVFAKPIILVVAPGFSPEKKSITAQYLRISAPAYLLMTSASIIGAMLQSHDRFFGSQVRELGTHISKIIFIFLCFRSLGVYAAVLAIVIGSIFRLLIQLPFINWNWKYRPQLRLKDPDTRDMLRGLPSVAVTAAILHINGLVDKMFASGAAEGSIACLNYGNRLMNVFSGMISTAISTATYPTMIEHIARGDKDKLEMLISKILQTLLFFILPVCLFCLAFSEQIVTVAFQRGAFDALATQLTARVFVGYSVGMFFFGASTVISNVFYGYGDTRITMRISILNIALNVILDFLLYQFLGVSGLALATSLASVICFIIRLWLLRRYISLPYRQIIREMAKLLLGAAFAVGASWLVFARLLSLRPVYSVIAGAALTAGLFFLLCLLLRIRTVDDVKAILHKRFSHR